MQDRRAETTLDSAPENPVNAITETEQKQKDMMSKVDAMVAAFSAPSAPARPGGDQRPGGDRARLPRPDPKFEGCWHCGAKGHTRRQCNKFKDLLKRSGMKEDDACVEGEEPRTPYPP